MIATLLGIVALVYWWKWDFMSPGAMRAQMIAPKQAGATYPNTRKLGFIENENRMQLSMAAQQQTTVRLPYGAPNAYQKTIETPAMLLTNGSEYPRSYQKNIKNIQIGTEDWRVDPKFNSPINNYASMHMPENNLSSVSKWGKGS